MRTRRAAAFRDATVAVGSILCVLVPLSRIASKRLTPEKLGVLLWAQSNDSLSGLLRYFDTVGFTLQSLRLWSAGQVMSNDEPWSLPLFFTLIAVAFSMLAANIERESDESAAVRFARLLPLLWGTFILAAVLEEAFETFCKPGGGLYATNGLHPYFIYIGTRPSLATLLGVVLVSASAIRLARIQPGGSSKGEPGIPWYPSSLARAF
jgi:hypothetical protein